MAGMYLMELASYLMQINNACTTLEAWSQLAYLYDTNKAINNNETLCPDNSFYSYDPYLLQRSINNDISNIPIIDNNNVIREVTPDEFPF